MPRAPPSAKHTTPKRILELVRWWTAIQPPHQWKRSCGSVVKAKAEEMDPTHYRWLDGSLRYLVHTRLAIGYLSRFMEQPTMENLQAAKRVLCYVAETLYKWAPGMVRFVDYCDSDLAGDINTSKSTSRTMFFLGDCLVSWQSIKNRVVALSSSESEYIATSSCNTSVWLSRLLGKLLGRKVDVDSKSALVVAKKLVFHDRKQAHSDQISLGGWERQGQPHRHY